MNNGKLIDDSLARFSTDEPAKPWPWSKIRDVAQWLLFLWMVVLFSIALLYGVPLAKGLIEAQQQMRQERDEDLKRTKMLESVRRQQNVQEAERLYLNEENVKAARELRKLLKKGD